MAEGRKRQPGGDAQDYNICLTQKKGKKKGGEGGKITKCTTSSNKAVPGRGTCKTDVESESGLPFLQNVHGVSGTEENVIAAKCQLLEAQSVEKSGVLVETGIPLHSPVEDNKEMTDQNSCEKPYGTKDKGTSSGGLMTVGEHVLPRPTLSHKSDSFISKDSIHSSAATPVSTDKEYVSKFSDLSSFKEGGVENISSVQAEGDPAPVTTDSPTSSVDKVDLPPLSGGGHVSSGEAHVPFVPAAQDVSKPMLEGHSSSVDLVFKGEDVRPPMGDNEIVMNATIPLAEFEVHYTPTGDIVQPTDSEEKNTCSEKDRMAIDQVDKNPNKELRLSPVQEKVLEMQGLPTCDLKSKQARSKSLSKGRSSSTSASKGQQAQPMHVIDRSLEEQKAELEKLKKLRDVHQEKLRLQEEINVLNEKFNQISRIAGSGPETDEDEDDHEIRMLKEKKRQSAKDLRDAQKKAKKRRKISCLNREINRNHAKRRRLLESASRHPQGLKMLERLKSSREKSHMVSAKKFGSDAGPDIESMEMKETSGNESIIHVTDDTESEESKEKGHDTLDNVPGYGSRLSDGNDSDHKIEEYHKTSNKPGSNTEEVVAETVQYRRDVSVEESKFHSKQDQPIEKGLETEEYMFWYQTEVASPVDVVENRGNDSKLTDNNVSDQSNESSVKTLDTLCASQAEVDSQELVKNERDLSQDQFMLTDGVVSEQSVEEGDEILGTVSGSLANSAEEIMDMESSQKTEKGQDTLAIPKSNAEVTQAEEKMENDEFIDMEINQSEETEANSDTPESDTKEALPEELTENIWDGDMSGPGSRLGDNDMELDQSVRTDQGTSDISQSHSEIASSEDHVDTSVMTNSNMDRDVVWGARLLCDMKRKQSPQQPHNFQVFAEEEEPNMAMMPDVNDLVDGGTKCAEQDELEEDQQVSNIPLTSDRDLEVDPPCDPEVKEKLKTKIVKENTDDKKMDYDDDEICPKCRKIADSGYINCSTCEARFHRSCVGDPAEEDWECKECKVVH